MGDKRKPTVRVKKKLEIEKQKPTGTLFSVNTLSQKSTNIKNFVAREAAFQFFSVKTFGSAAAAAPSHPLKQTQCHKTPATDDGEKWEKREIKSEWEWDDSWSSVSESGVCWEPFGEPYPVPPAQAPAPVRGPLLSPFTAPRQVMSELCGESAVVGWVEEELSVMSAFKARK